MTDFAIECKKQFEALMSALIWLRRRSDTIKDETPTISLSSETGMTYAIGNYAVRQNNTGIFTGKKQDDSGWKWEVVE